VKSINLGKLVLFIFSVALLLGCSASAIKEGAANNGLSTNGVSKSVSVTVSTGADLQAALTAAVPGTTILVNPGTYTIPLTTVQVNNNFAMINKTYYFNSYASGTASAHITLTAADPNNEPILSGGGISDGYTLYIHGSYWDISNIKATNSQKGIILDQSLYTTIKNCEVYTLGDEGIHIRDGSSYCVIDGCYVHDSGELLNGFGEGIYVGSDNSVWKEGNATLAQYNAVIAWDAQYGLLNNSDPNYPGNGISGEKGYLYSRDVHNNTIQNCQIGPNITAEPFDIKEGSTYTTVRNNVIHGSGIAGIEYADSNIDIKGCTCDIYGNTFYQDGNSILAKSIAIVPRTTAGAPSQYTAQDNYIHDNTFNIDSGIVCVLVGSGSGTTYVLNNTKVPNSGKIYSGSVTQSAPPGYSSSSSSVSSSSSSSKSSSSSSVASSSSVSSSSSSIASSSSVSSSSSSIASSSSSSKSSSSSSVASSSSSKSSSSSSSSSVGTIPAAPTKLKDSTQTSSSITLTWAAPSGTVTGYNMYRSDSSNGQYVPVAKNITALTYTDTGLAADTKYYYEVTAFNNAGESAMSSSQKGKTDK
jgi:hypothetical protein